MVAHLPVATQRALLAVRQQRSPDVDAVVALSCVEELVDDLVGVQVDGETLFGHLALAHGAIPDVAGTRTEWLAAHRAAHRQDGRYVGHRA